MFEDNVHSSTRRYFTLNIYVISEAYYKIIWLVSIKKNLEILI